MHRNALFNCTIARFVEKRQSRDAKALARRFRAILFIYVTYLQNNRVYERQSIDEGR